VNADQIVAILARLPPGSKHVQTIHDEAVFEIPDGKMEEAKAALAQVPEPIEFKFELPTPVPDWNPPPEKPQHLYGRAARRAEHRNRSRR
jgi:hypothetical protein